jgi:phage portal protein BeeE
MSLKSINPWNVDDNRGWDIIGATSGASELELVPVLAECVDEVAKSLADLPFTIYDARGKAVDDSDNYKNVTGAIPDPYTFLWLAGASLVLTGQAYWRKESNAAGYAKRLKYYAADNVKPIILPDTTPDTLKFERSGQTEKIAAKDLLYAWLPDPRVEFGPPTNYPFRRAMKAAGATSALSAFVTNYLNNGMVRAFIAQSEQPPANPEEKRETEDYLTRMLTGVRAAIQKIRVFTKGWTFTSIGGGLDEIKNVAVIREIKIDILEAFGVPQQRIWGDSANYATASLTTMNFITSEIMPLARVVQNALNEQLFKPYGYHIEFEPRRMDEFAILIAEQVKSLYATSAAFEKAIGPQAALLASIDILGLDISTEIIAMIEKAALEATRTPEPAPVQVVPEQTQTQEPPMPEQERTPGGQSGQPRAVPQKAIVELDRWELKSEKAGKLVTWHAVDLPAEIVEGIKGGMSWQAARAALLLGEDEPGEVADILRGIELAVKALERT